MRRLLEALQRQLRLNERKNLLHADARRILRIDPAFLASLEEALADPGSKPGAEGLRDLAAAAAASLIDRVYAINQYIQIPASARETLRAIYLRTWERIVESRDIESALRGYHYPQLSAWLDALYPQPLKSALRSREMLGEVTCQDYPAQLQLRLLRIRASGLRQPVLDIGCGKEALLVEHLRQLGIDAHGLDRVLKTRGPHLQEADWLEAAYEKRRWGTILSNMAFTNHFAYVRQYETHKARRYLDKYLEILEALQPGGCFLYGPGAPEMEGAVDGGRFSVERWTVAYGYGATRVTRLRRQGGEAWRAPGACA